MALLEITGLVFAPGRKPILNMLEMTIDAGEVHALLGTNGTGKSTLAQVIMGCEGYAPAAGEMRFDGRLLNPLPIHERARLGISLAWQEPVRFEGITVQEYLGLKSRQDPARCLAMVGLAPERYLSRMVDRRLSGGERKRIELASILALRPRLAVLDEPDSGIDMLSIGDIINVAQTFREAGTALLLITHREEIALIADRASEICHGKIVCTGNPAKVAEFYKERRCLTCSGEVCVHV